VFKMYGNSHQSVCSKLYILVDVLPQTHLGLVTHQWGGGDSVKEENIVFVPFRVGSLSKVWQKKEETAIVSRECSEAITV
jgi:hypothetical protein